MLKEFREFAIRGNVVDMAVGLIIGAAFGAIVTSLVNDVIMPPIGLLLGGVDFANLFVVLKEGAKATGSVRHAGRRQGCQRRDAEHRRLHQRDHQLHDRRLRGVHGGQGRQRRASRSPRRRRPRHRHPRRASSCSPRSATCSRRASAAIEEPPHARSAARDDGHRQRRVRHRRGPRQSPRPSPRRTRQTRSRARWRAPPAPARAGPAAAWARPCTAITQSDESRQPGSPGNSDATWPSGPTPSTTRSRCGGVPATAHNVR